jgi:YD repeat-containing protein
MARNRLETQTLPTISGLGASVFTYTYDTAGNLASETRPATNIAVGTADRKTTYAYDALHRLTLETRPAPGGVSTHAAPTTAFTYDDVGNKASVTDPEKRLTKYDYDAANRLVTITAPAEKAEKAEKGQGASAKAGGRSRMKESYKVRLSQPPWPRVMRSTGQPARAKRSQRYNRAVY